MKKLFLLRHGEAGFTKGRDIQRQLTENGILKLENLGSTLKNRGFEVDLMYCSPAQRTRETAHVLKKYVPVQEEVIVESIYDGDLGDLFELLENTSDSIQNCLVVGHNPIISLLLSRLTEEEYFTLSPGSFCVIEFPFESWKMIGVNTGILQEVLT